MEIGDVVAHTAAGDETATVEKVEVAELATSDLGRSCRMKESVDDRLDPSACLDAFGLEAWLCASIEPERPSDFVDSDILDSSVGSFVTPDATFAPAGIDRGPYQPLLVGIADVEARLYQSLLHLVLEWLAARVVGSSSHRGTLRDASGSDRLVY